MKKPIHYEVLLEMLKRLDILYKDIIDDGSFSAGYELGTLRSLVKSLMTPNFEKDLDEDDEEDFYDKEDQESREELENKIFDLIEETRSLNDYIEKLKEENEKALDKSKEIQLQDFLKCLLRTDKIYPGAISDTISILLLTGVPTEELKHLVPGKKMDFLGK